MGQIWDKDAAEHVGRHRAQSATQTRRTNRRALVRLAMAGLVLCTVVALAATKPAGLVVAACALVMLVLPVAVYAAASAGVRRLAQWLVRLLPVAVLAAVVGCTPEPQPSGSPIANLPAAPAITSVRLSPFEGGR